MTRQVQWAGGAIALGIVLVVTATPAHMSAMAQKKPVAAPARPLAWPLPPDQPRIRYVSAYRGVDDFKTAKKRGWKDILLGADDTPQAAEMLVKPYGIAVSPQGTVFVTDTAARRVFVFDPESRTVNFFADTGAGKLTKPTGIAVDGDGRVFIADATLNRVFGFAPNGALQVAIGHEGDLKAPSGLAIDRERHLLYVADSTLHKVFCYSSTDGSAVRTIGTRGDQNGEFNFPTNIFVDSQGQLYVADTLNFRIQIFGHDGAFVRAFGTQGDVPGTFNRPKGVAVDSEGHIYVADTSFNNFQIFQPDGTLLLTVGSGGREAGEFQLPAGMSIDAQDRIYVADQGNSRVQVFQYLQPGTARVSAK